jgi:formylglycine-generating enzyme required for sulfatase activity
MTKGSARYVRRLALLSAAAAVVAACAKVAGIDDLSIGECKGGDCLAEGGIQMSSPDAAETSTTPLLDGAVPFDGSALPCVSQHGPTMVRVGTSSNNFCIDSTEVTVSQYAEFTTAKGADAGGQPTECAWNTSYAAGAGGGDNIPIAGIDWCDARAYCAWAGKRLCGKHVSGAFAGKVDVSELGDFKTHEWLLACSNIGQLRYPYGGIQNPTACNTAENDAGRTVDVKSKPECNGGFPGVYDMVGNLWEWFDGPCLPPDAGTGDAGDAGGPQKEECIVKGGAFLNAGIALDCRVDGRGATRDRRGVEIGVRCCSD